MNDSAIDTGSDAPDTVGLASLLEKQFQLAQQLQGSVDAVSIAVTQPDYDTLDQLLSTKTEILNQIDRHNSDLQNWLLAHGFENNAVSDAISTVDQHSELLELWQNSKQIVLDCQLKNFANGSIVRGRLKHTQQILNLLTGQETDAKTPYTSQGVCGETVASRPLAKV